MIRPYPISGRAEDIAGQDSKAEAHENVQVIPAKLLQRRCIERLAESSDLHRTAAKSRCVGKIGGQVDRARRDRLSENKSLIDPPEEQSVRQVPPKFVYE